MHTSLLPDNATAWERAMSSAMDDSERLGPVFEQIAVADRTPPPKLLPWLVWQYGLGELSPYLPNLYDLIDEGVRWQRLRGTPAAIAMSLRWLGYGGRIEEEATWRRRWNRFQIRLDRVRGADEPDLVRIDAAAGLSAPVRSHFSRGFAGHDVRAVITARSRTAEAIWSDHSGVSLPGSSARWSFGREWDFHTVIGRKVLELLEAWIPDVADDGLWRDDHNLWADEKIVWSATPTQERRKQIIAALVSNYQPWLRFDAPSGKPVGYRRARLHGVAPATDGEFSSAGSRWTALTNAPDAVLLRARTGFGDGAGHTAASIAPVFGGGPRSGLKPGLAWLEPDQFEGGLAIDASPVRIPFGLTVRERCTVLLTF